ncbi:13414_t:CDS:2, partial [Ambispora gerdemannii]
KPGFLQALQVVPSINLTHEEHYFAFDETLKTFRVKFIKENMTRQMTNSENLKQNIKVTQAESSQSVKDHQEALWKLITELKVEFSSSQPESHLLFAEVTQLIDVGFQQMFTCYESGIKRIITIVEQNIYHTVPQVKAG